MAALGIIEVKGYAAAMAAADAMRKAAGVRILNELKHTDGAICLFIRADDVGSVKAATDAGAEAAKPHGQVVAIHVIARPDAAAVGAITGDADWDKSERWIPKP